MTKDLTRISQAEIKTLLKERFENPGKFGNIPLILWKALYNDDIQQTMVMDLQRPEMKKPKEDRRFLRLISLRVGQDYHEKLTAHRESRTVGFIVYTDPTLTLESCLNEVKKVMAANDMGLPLIVYLPSSPQPIDLPGEQYIFDPDFEQWAQTFNDPLIADFIRGDGRKDGIIYRWYNLFNDPAHGVSTPMVWQSVRSWFRRALALEKRTNSNFTIRDLDEHLIRSAFNSATDRFKGHVSPDVIEDFTQYLKNIDNG